MPPKGKKAGKAEKVKKGRGRDNEDEDAPNIGEGTYHLSV